MKFSKLKNYFSNRLLTKGRERVILFMTHADEGKSGSANVNIKLKDILTVTVLDVPSYIYIYK